MSAVSHGRCECGRSTSFRTHRNRRRRAKKDHDLCYRCFRKLLDAERAARRSSQPAEAQA